MLLTLAVLAIGGTGLFTGPVQAAVENFNLVGENITTDGSLLCPNTTYTFLCEISGGSLQLISYNGSGSSVDFFSTVSAVPIGGTPESQIEFDFLKINSTVGLAAIAVVDSSTGLSSVELECRDVTNTMSITLSTVVKHPLDLPELMIAICLTDCQSNITFINVTWGPVACAGQYILDIAGLERVTTTETSFQMLYDNYITNLSGSVSAIGGSVLSFFQECSVPCDDNSRNPPGNCTLPTDGVCFGVNITSVTLDCGSPEICYNITFSSFPADGQAYYETPDGRFSITVRGGVSDEICIDSEATVYAAFGNGTVFCSQGLQEPSVSGVGVCCIWRTVSIVLLVVIIVCFFGVLAAVIIAKCVFGKTKVSNQGKSRDNVDLASDESEMKLRGSDM